MILPTATWVVFDAYQETVPDDDMKLVASLIKDIDSHGLIQSFSPPGEPPLPDFMLSDYRYSWATDRYTITELGESLLNYLGSNDGQAN